MKSIVFSILMTISSLLLATDYSSTIKGQVIDQESKFPLIGASVQLFQDSTVIDGMSADIDGRFQFNDIQIGKYTLVISSIGYHSQTIPNVVVNAGKETVLTIELEETTEMLQEAEIIVSTKDQNNNEMISVSARTFTVEETSRYPGSRSDPARMASNFAGVQGANDTRNDIVVRGNSPTGVLWRIEGVDIFNPNHFAISGTNGGPVSVLNSKVFSKSDFITSAFPSEYGNGTSGVFDIKFRNGNRDKNEFTGQFGFLGTELTGEGPLGKKGTYLFAYRYSTLSMFHALGISIGTSAVPKYQDLSYKFNFQLKNNASLSFFGIGGMSNINIIVSDYEKPTGELYGYQDRDQYFFTNIGMAGVSYKKSVSKKLFYEVIAATNAQDIHSNHDLVYRPEYVEGQDWGIDSMIYNKLKYKHLTFRHTAKTNITQKLNTKNTLKYGMEFNLWDFDMNDTNYVDTAYVFENRLDVHNQAFFTQAYAQWKHKFTDRLQMVTGLHGQLLTLNNTYAIEPRVGFKWLATDKQVVSLGYGKHSQMQPVYFYFQKMENQEGNQGEWNKDLGFSNAHHLVLSYDHSLKKMSRLKIETYYQYLNNIPVAADSSDYSMLNFGSTFRQEYPGNLVNEGEGYNYGIEFTIEKYFSKQFFFLTTLSLYDSKYRNFEGEWKNTAFNGNYTYNLLAGKEIVFGKNKNKTIGFGGKLTLTGGRRYTPIDLEASNLANEAVYDLTQINALQYDPYFRLDGKLSYKVNTKKLTHELAIDLINLTNKENVFTESYVAGKNGEPGQIVTENQLMFLPIFYYKIDF